MFNTDILEREFLAPWTRQTFLKNTKRVNSSFQGRESNIFVRSMFL